MRLFIVCIFLFNVIAIGNAQSVKKFKIDELLATTSNADTTYVLNFWSTFCGPCVVEIPDFINVAQKYKTKAVMFIFVSLDFPEDYHVKV